MSTPPKLPKTRLDPLVDWKQHEVEKAKVVLAARLKATAEALSRIAACKAELDRLPSQLTSADQWELIERATVRAREDLVRAERDAAAAQLALRGAQDAYAEAHRQAEVFRRASDRQRQALIREVERAERRTLDELALLLLDRRK